MIIKAFLNAHGLNELGAGGTCTGYNKATDAFAFETWLDTHEYTITASALDVSGIGRLSVETKKTAYAAPQVAKVAVAPTPTPVAATKVP